MMRMPCSGRKWIGIVGIFCFLVLSPSAWSSVFVRWTNSGLPAPEALGFSDLVVSWNEGAVPLMQAASNKKYRVYLEVSVQHASAAADQAAKNGWAGIILRVPQREREAALTALARLREAYPQLKF